MIIHRWKYGNEEYRLVGLGSSGSGNALEKMDRDAAGGERWTTVKFGVGRPYGGGFGIAPSDAECILLAGIRDLASKRDAVAATMMHYPRNRHG